MHQPTVSVDSAPRTRYAAVNEIATREIARIKHAIEDSDYYHAVIAAYRSLGRPQTAELFIGAVEEQRVAMAVAS
jgi:hypothetical protein